MLERGKQARHADGKSRRRHRLAAKARDEAIITPAAADRTEARRTGGAVGRESQFNLEDWAGVIFEAADDGGVNKNLISVVASGYAQVHDGCEFGDAIASNCRVTHTVRKY